MEQIGFAVVGYGRIGRRHAAIIETLPEAKLCALVDVDKDGVRGSGSGAEGPDRSPGKVPLFRTLEELLDSEAAEEISVVNIATPNGFHAANACTALEAGLHVVIEKPLALSAGDARRVLDTAARLKKHVFTVMQNRYSPSAMWLKQLVCSGKLGRIFMVQMNCYWNRDGRYYRPGGWHGTRDLDGGTLFTQFSHWVDMLYWLFGEITEIRGRMNNFAHGESTGFEDSGFISFDFDGGGMGCLNFSTAVWEKNLESSLTIIAEYGSVKIGGQYMERVEYFHGRDMVDFPGIDRCVMGSGDTMPAPAGPEAHHRRLLENVVDVLKGRSASHIDPEDGWKVVEIIERIYKG